MVSSILSAVSLAGLAAAAVIQNHGGSHDWRSKIKNIVVLVEENRSFDTFAGGLDYAPMDNNLHNNYCNSLQVQLLCIQHGRSVRD
jgi:phospholipase C